MFNLQTYVSPYNSSSVQLGTSMDSYRNRVLEPLREWWAMLNAIWAIPCLNAHDVDFSSYSIVLSLRG